MTPLLPWIKAMSKPRVDYSENHLEVTSQAGVARIEPGEIEMVDECQMEDQIHHGDEAFHILHGSQRFWLVGPFIDGALGAINRFCTAHPDIPRRRVLIRSLPWKLRAPGLLGLRLFPIAGLGEFPLADLPTIVPMEDPSGGSSDC